MKSLNALIFPERDTTPGKVVAEISAGETGPPAENLVSNEDSTTRCLDEIRRRAPRGGVFLGVGPEQNLSMIAACRPEIAFILDFRRRNLRVHLLHKALAMLSDRPEESLGRLIARRATRPVAVDASAADRVAAFADARLDRDLLRSVTAEVRRVTEPLGILRPDEWADMASIAAKIAGPGLGARFLGLPGYPTLGHMITGADRGGSTRHYLADPERYALIRAMHLGDLILPVVGDFAAGPAMGNLEVWLRRNDLRIAAIYLSDVEFFLLRAGTFPEFIRRLKGLPRLPDSLIIRTSTRPIDHRDRFPGDQCTTVVRDLSAFLDRASQIRKPDDLFD